MLRVNKQDSRRFWGQRVLIPRQGCTGWWEEGVGGSSSSLQRGGKLTRCGGQCLLHQLGTWGIPIPLVKGLLG